MSRIPNPRDLDFKKIFGVKKDDAVTDVGSGSDGSKHLDHLANLVCEANPGTTREQALHWLIHHKNGRAFAAQAKRKNAMSKLDQLKSIVKSNDNGLRSIAKCIVSGQPSGLSEHEFAQLVSLDAERTKQANETREQAFSRRFCAQDEEGALLRKAHAMIKNMPMMTPVRPQPSPAPVDTSTSALKQLEAMASDLRKREPQLSPEQAFAKVYAQHPQLASAERQQNRPRVA